MSNVLLEVKNLKAKFPTPKGDLHVLNGVSFKVNRQECFGIIGESGCGKTMTAMSILHYADRLGLQITDGEIIFEGEDVLQFSPKRLREYNGKEAAIILQNPMEALDPLYTVKNQMYETIKKHRKVTTKEASAIMYEVAKELSIAPEKLDCYPHELSGGMLQRIVGAMIVICRPKLIIADEPTTALDVTTQLQYLKLLKRIQKEYHTSIIFVSHDIKVVSMICDRIAVMYAGEIVEIAPVNELLCQPKHPYTRALLQSANLERVIRNKYETIEGTPPGLLEEIHRCPFEERCKYAAGKCYDRKPEIICCGDGHKVKCHYPLADK